MHCCQRAQRHRRGRLAAAALLQRTHLFDRSHLVPSEPVHLRVSEFAVLDSAVEAPARSTPSQAFLAPHRARQAHSRGNVVPAPIRLRSLRDDSGSPGTHWQRRQRRRRHPPREGSRGEPECEGGYHEEPPQQQSHPSESIGWLMLGRRAALICSYGGNLVGLI